LAKYEVTQGQWQKVMGNNPSHFKKGGNYPVEFVSWVATKAFISTLNAKNSAKFRLPTEAEWEYAARNGGKPEKYSGGDHIDRVAWYGSDYRSGSTQQVGTKVPNGLGLFDMSGNVWEWCEDVYGSYPSSSQDNPIATGDEAGRVIRGGGWSNGPQNVRSTARRNVSPAEWNSDVGFRLVRIP
jgi:formylglycine-generating enzyme required for sulfatase activity